MAKHVFHLALAIAVGIAVAKMFGGSFNLTSLFSGLTTPAKTA
jgi:predicted Kef-type K+ transport protein